ncbi:MAG: hypothetical protein ACFFCV_13030 [Promethearchaeota archaeon]
MKKGKLLVLLGAVLTLISTFLFSFAQTISFDGRTLSSGIGFLFNLPEIWRNPGYWIATFPSYTVADTPLIYLFSILYLIFVLSGVIQLVGAKIKYVAIVGSVLTIVFGALLLVYFNDLGGDLEAMNRFSALFLSAPIAEGVLPLHVPIINSNSFAYQTISLGTIILFVGGSLGLVGGVLSIKDI